MTKHPTIVKNGGANGTANAMEAQELGTIEDENTKVNPELATVAWTSDKKVDSNKEEEKPLKEEKAED